MVRVADREALEKFRNAMDEWGPANVPVLYDHDRTRPRECHSPTPFSPPLFFFPITHVKTLYSKISAIDYKWKEVRANCIKNKRKRRGSLMGGVILLGK